MKLRPVSSALGRDPEPRGMTDAVALRAFVDELVRAGMRDVVVCPGSRSTPLALALRAHPGLRVRVLLDERSAGFFALGLARASGRATGVLVTSGTAAANLLPAAVEATLGRVPAGAAHRRPTARAPRPRRAAGHRPGRACSAATSNGAPSSRSSTGSRRRAATSARVAGRAVATALAGPAGAVHLNVPFREPLIPDGDLRARADVDGEPSRPFTDVLVGPRTLGASTVADLAARLAAARRGLIVAGPQDDPGPAAPRSPGWRRRPASRSSPTRCPGARCGPHDRSRVVAPRRSPLPAGPVA